VSPVAYVSDVGETVMLIDPDDAGNAVLCAEIVTGVTGAFAGAVYTPEVEIVPSEAEPPATLFTSHVTVVVLDPVTVAVYCPVWPNNTFAGPLTPTVTGSTVTPVEPIVVFESTLTAEIVTAVEVVTVGAVYNPVAEIVPTVELPPATLFTSQFTD